MPNYLLQEDGFKILQEDGSGILLEQNILAVDRWVYAVTYIILIGILWSPHGGVIFENLSQWVRRGR